MMEFLTKYSDLITLFFTIAVGVSTIVYAFLTIILVRETRKMRKAQTDPHIFVNLEHSEFSISFIDLVVKNIGYGPAYNVTFNVTKDFEMQRKGNISEIGFIKNGLKYFAPNQSTHQFIASFINDKSNLADREIEIQVKYKNSTGNQFDEIFLLSFTQFKHTTQLGSGPPIYKISKEFEKLNTYLGHIVSDFKRLNINVFDSDDRKNEEEKLNEEYEDFMKSQENTEE